MVMGAPVAARASAAPATWSMWPWVRKMRPMRQPTRATVQSLPVIKDYATRYRAAAQKAGRKPYICLMRDAVVASSMKEAEAESGPTMYTHRFYFQYGAYVPDEYLKDIKRPEELTFAKAARDRLIVGSPDDCLAQLQRWQKEIHPDYLIIRFRQPGGPSHQQTLEAIRVFGEKVIPEL
jgi:alkanesulfonate monooxygenase SsuD/methylene tetrahydromethanopterin reductase-like flavin-dependent oxidoreductase (luciferase family)